MPRSVVPEWGGSAVPSRALAVRTACPAPLPCPVCSRHALCGTWLWGSMQVRNHRFDPKADLYSLSFIFAEVGGQLSQCNAGILS